MSDFALVASIGWNPNLSQQTMWKWNLEEQEMEKKFIKNTFQVTQTIVQQDTKTVCLMTSQTVTVVRILLWYKGDLALGFTDTVKHITLIIEEWLVSQLHRRITPSHYRKLKEHTKKHLKQDVIQPSHSPYASSIVIVGGENENTDGCAWTINISMQRLGRTVFHFLC